MEINQYQEEEISLRSLIQTGKAYYAENLRHWFVPVLFAFAGLAIMAYRYFIYEPLYPAKITFSVDEDEGGGASALTGILGQFGLGGVRPTRYNLDKILALSKSRRVIQRTLFAQIDVDGKNDFIANHLIRAYKLNKPSKLHPEENGFLFSHDSLPLFSPRENEMLMSIYGLIIGPENKPKEALMKADYNEDTNIMSIEVTTTHETLSYELTNRMFESLSEYYINKSTEKQKQTFKIVSEKRDSVLAVLTAAEYQLANFRDTHRGLLMRTDQLTEFRLQREVAGLTAMYGEVVKNVEVADFTLKNKTPFIQIIDSPLLPIRPALLSIIRQFALGILLGGFIGVLLISLRKVFRDAMAVPG